MPRLIEGRRFFSIAEVVESAEVSRQTLWRWRSLGHIPAGQRFRNGQVVFSELEIRAIRAYANRLEPAEVYCGVDNRNALSKNKTKVGPNSPSSTVVQESL